jgi:hypothetical protein
MLNATLGRIVRVCRATSAFHILATNFLAVFVLLLFGSMISASAQDSKPAAAPPPTAPSPGKALIYIYRVGRFVGSAAHDEYAWMEVAPGTVVVKGTPEMYYAGGVALSSFAAIHNSASNAHERIRLEVEAGKTYYMKWTSGTMATGIKVTLMDTGVGAKEMKGLHISPPVQQPDAKNKEEAK